MNDEILYNRLYERTKKFGRNQFVREMTRLERENKQLQQERDKYKSIVDGIKQTLLKEIKDGRSEQNLWLMGCYDEAKEILTKIKELEDRGVNND